MCIRDRYDCSTMSFEDNIAAVARMVKYCHLRNVTVEGELGHVGANEGGSAEGNDTGSIYTDPFEAQTYAERTGVDALAVSYTHLYHYIAYTSIP